MVGGDHAEAVRGKDDRVADWRGQFVSGARARESEGECGWRVGSACQREEYIDNIVIETINIKN